MLYSKNIYSLMPSASAAETEDSVLVYGDKSPHTNGSNKKRTDTWCVKAHTQEKVFKKNDSEASGVVNCRGFRVEVVKSRSIETDCAGVASLTNRRVFTLLRSMSYVPRTSVSWRVQEIQEELIGWRDWPDPVSPQQDGLSISELLV